MKSLSRVRLLATPWTAAYQAPPSMGVPRQEYWSGLPFLSPGDLPDLGIEPRSPALEADALTSESPGRHIILSLISQQKRIHLQNRRCGFYPWVGKIPWRKKWQPIPVFLPGKTPQKEQSGWLRLWGHKRVRHNLVTKERTT